MQTKTSTKLERTCMYKLKEIEEELKLLEQYDRQLSITARALGINRYTLRSWRDKRRKGEPLLLETRNRPSKCSKEEKNK